MSEDTQDGRRSIWTPIVPVIAGGALTLIGGVIGSYFTFINAGRDLDIKMIELSLSILGGEKGGADDPAEDVSYVEARLFALRTLKKYSGVEIADEVMRPWAQGGRIPSAAAVLPYPNTTGLPSGGLGGGFGGFGGFGGPGGGLGSGVGGGFGGFGGSGRGLGSGFGPSVGDFAPSPIAEIPNGYSPVAAIEGSNIITKSVKSNDRLILGKLSAYDCLGFRDAYIEKLVTPDAFKTWKSSFCKSTESNRSERPD
ncbi:MAG TPA: hypothetical protein VGO04_12560 [Ensifer sp.]|jgi:hypothetical protein|uniref:hypothetical protein n=1 Tax=Ensifer sp. TaxID=1872086 RepID=UPI002E0FA4A9|nr:hypothetical protein [Ensifer sp.]